MGRAPAAVPGAREEERDLDPEQLFEREAAPRGLCVLRALGKMNLCKRRGQRGQPALAPPRLPAPDRGSQASRGSHPPPGAEPALGDALGEPVDRRDAGDPGAPIDRSTGSNSGLCISRPWNGSTGPEK